MNFFSQKVERPGIALGVIFFIGLLLSQYGVVNGSLYLFDMLVGIIVYKALIRR